MNIVIAGASGFIGSELMRRIPEAKGISRTESNDPRFIHADLFSRSMAEKALKGCDVAIYLVHSMLPSSQLDQGDFQDFDLIISDNFAKACKSNKVKRIIYLAGLLPNVERAELSKHLRSRKEVEDILKKSEVPLTTVRAGLIIGSKGSSFNILKSLATRLPIMVYPNWLNTKMEPVGLEQVLESIIYCVNNKETSGRTYDLSMGVPVKYQDLMYITRELLNKKSMHLHMYVPTFVVQHWMSLISGAPKNLVNPLVESLRHDMLAREDRILKVPNFVSKSLKELIKDSLFTTDKTPHAFKKKPKNKIVRSIQRIEFTCPNDVKLYQIYFNWLSHFFGNILKVETDQETCVFKVGNLELLKLKHVKIEKEENQELMEIIGGILVSKNPNKKMGILEFRKMEECIIVAIHNYMPSLSWLVYPYTQAQLHAFVMKRFASYLKKNKKIIDSSIYQKKKK